MEKANIAVALTITWPGQPVIVDPAFFRAVPILDHYATPATRVEHSASRSRFLRVTCHGPMSM